MRNTKSMCDDCLRLALAGAPGLRWQGPRVSVGAFCVPCKKNLRDMATAKKDAAHLFPIPAKKGGA